MTFHADGGSILFIVSKITKRPNGNFNVEGKVDKIMSTAPYLEFYNNTIKLDDVTAEEINEKTIK